MPHISSLPTPIPTLSPQPIPTPTKVPLPTPTPTSTPQPLLNQTDYMISQINDYRKSQGLYAVKTDPYTCSFVAIRAMEIATGFNHDGFNRRVNDHTLPYPSYRRVTENLAETSGGYQSVVGMWANSSGHAANMRADTPFVCVQSYGNFYAYEGWKP